MVDDNSLSIRKDIEKKIHQNVGGKPRVQEYLDANNESQIDIYIGVSQPDEDSITCATIGLHEYSIGLELEDEGKELRAEFIGMCDRQYEFYPNIVASCAFNIINSDFACKPGVVYSNVVKAFYPDCTVPHMLLTSPAYWEDLDETITEDRVIAWLTLIPISEAEYLFLQENGSDALEDLLEENNVDIFDFYRQSLSFK